jgi:hypothetical protein
VMRLGLFVRGLLCVLVNMLVHDLLYDSTVGILIGHLRYIGRHIILQKTGRKWGVRPVPVIKAHFGRETGHPIPWAREKCSNHASLVAPSDHQLSTYNRLLCRQRKSITWVSLFFPVVSSAAVASKKRFSHLFSPSMSSNRE